MLLKSVPLFIKITQYQSVDDSLSFFTRLSLVFTNTATFQGNYENKIKVNLNLL